MNSFQLTGENPSVKIMAGYSKRRKKDTIPLHQSLITPLLNWFESKPERDRTTLLFPLKTPSGHFRSTGKEKEKIAIWTNTELVNLEHKYSPLIIPPIPNKRITSSPIFSHLWTKAFEYLYEAKKIVIVGYSCPATDVMARSMFNQFHNKETTDIYIVDPDSNVLGSYEKLMRGCVKKKYPVVLLQRF